MSNGETEKAWLRLLEEVAGPWRTEAPVGGNEVLAEQLKAIYQGQIEAIRENTKALAASTPARGAGEVLKEAASGILGSIAKSGLGSMPLVSGLIKLFGGRREPEAPPVLTPYAPPRSVQIEAGLAAADNRIALIDYGQGGRPRAIPSASPATQVTVQVQAMDSRSFLDHSDDIARAVRQAMLNAHTLNDVVQEL